MASSSSHKSHQDYKLKVEEGDWLELGLGLGFRKPEDHGSHPVSGPLSLTSAPSSSSSSLPLQTNLGLGLGLELRAGLGLGLGLSLKIDNESVRQVGMAPPSSNYHNLLCPDNCDPYHHYNYSNDDDEDEDEHGDDNSMPSSWPWHMESGGAFLGLHDWQMAVPNNSHDYSTPRPHPPGLWFTLRSLTNRDGEVLPQIPKAYIRVKDENVTVFMVKKYLVRKLGLSNEAQIDISCLGQNLLHTQTLKQVRDAVWLPRLLESVNSTLSLEDSHDGSTRYLMSLHYERRCVLN